MPIDFDGLLPQLESLARQMLCQRCKELISVRDYRTDDSGNYHIECYKQERK